MRTIKHILIILLVGITFNCTNRLDFNGFYYGRYNDLPVLVRFDNNEYIDYFSVPFDTFTYKRIGNTFKFISKSHKKKYDLTIIQVNDFLDYYRPNSDTLIFRLKKSESSNFLFDYLKDKNLKIELPNGNGKTQIYGENFRFHNPMYFSKIGKKLFVNFNDSTIQLDDEFYNFLLDYKSKLTNIDEHSFPITLIADKNLNLTEINKLKEQLRIVGYNKILYLLATTKYDNVNTITRYTPPLSESEILKYDANNFPFPSLPPPPPEPELSFIKEYGIVIESANGILSLNNKPVDKTELQKILKEKIKSDARVILAYYIIEDSKYQDYINLQDIITNVYYDLRDEYLMSKYGIKFRGLLDVDNRYDEARKEIPMKNIELDSDDYKTIKYAL